MLVKDGDADDLRAAVAVAVIDVRNGANDFRSTSRFGVGASGFRAGLTQLIAGVFCRHGGEVIGDDLSGLAEIGDTTVVQPEGAVADGFDVGHGMADEEDGYSTGAELADLAHGALAKAGVADGERLIDEQNFGVNVNGDGEGQPDDHATGVGFDRLIDEIANIGEGFDFGVAFVNLACGETQDGAIEIDVSAAGEFRVKAGAEFQERRHPPVDPDGPGGGLQDTGNELEEGAFP